MDRLFVPSFGPADWRRLLADPRGQWKPGKSALESAVAWESARKEEDGLPMSVRDLLATHELTRGAKLVIGLPELQVNLRGGGHASQTDLWALLGTPDRLISAAFEAKSGEKLGDTVAEWLDGASEKSGKPDRLEDIGERLGFEHEETGPMRYQLLHRSASATKLARRFRAEIALLVVHSFGGASDHKSWAAFEEFGTFMGVTATKNHLSLVTRTCEVPLLIGWLSDHPANVERLRAAV
jgi:uncharacterized protein DUF6946